MTVENQIGKKQRYGERITCRKTEPDEQRTCGDTKHSERGACVITILGRSVSRTVKQTLKGSLRGRAQRKQQETQIWRDYDRQYCSGGEKEGKEYEASRKERKT